jgi:hypothetical protein
MPLNKKGKKIMEKMKKEYGKKKGESVFYAMENSGKLKGVKKAKQGMMANLKPVPAGKEKSLGKLPPEVRNRMGYAKYGKMMKAKMGAQVSDKEIETIKKLANAQVSDKEAKNQRENLRIETIKKLAGAQVSDKEAKKIMAMMPNFKDSPVTREAKMTAIKNIKSMMPKKSHGGSMKKGYGKARSSGMGLEDESLVPGKGYEYIKDLL